MMTALFTLLAIIGGLVVLYLAAKWALTHAPGPVPQQPVIRFTVRTSEGVTVQGEKLMLLLTDTQKVALSIAVVDAKGVPAKIDGIPAWEVSDPNVGSIAVAEDGLSAVFSAGLPGTCQASVTADADLGEGVVTIAGVIDFEVVAGQAVAVTITAGAPEEQ
jgi:hypothetical protein